MKKLVVLSAFLVFAYVGVNAQNKPASVTNASQKIEGSEMVVSENEKPVKMEAKKECSDKKKECHDKKGGKSKKSCCADKSKKECGDKKKAEASEHNESK